ncbi:hypothetical protein AB4Z22_43295, partial [Paenibacillus sp. TAF58]
FAMPKPTRLVQIGEAAGPGIRLTGDALRTSGLEIYGAARNLASGMATAYGQVVDWVRDGDLVMNVTTMPLSRIGEAWQRTDLRGSRLVIVRRVRQMDEYQVKLFFPGLAVGFAVAIVTAITVGTLSSVGLARFDGGWLVAITGIVAWEVTNLVVGAPQR